MFHAFFMLNRQGKLRIERWYSMALKNETERGRQRAVREIFSLIQSRDASKTSSIVEWRDKKFVYKRYASLYTVAVIDPTDNELIALSTMHRFVELLDRKFENVCELDITYCFLEVYGLLDEMIIAGELCESSLKQILLLIEVQEGQQSLENLDLLGVLQFSSVQEPGFFNPKAHAI
mmetsp:Transcript_27906/g.69985  ORF Transcript_27906/g.69985 Transcript_27906/m.69985 type:complete len:177 (-) Transcript_27906:38-568(-)